MKIADFSEAAMEWTMTIEGATNMAKSRGRNCGSKKDLASLRLGLWCKPSESMKNARDHCAAQAARTAFQTAGALLSLIRDVRERELTFSNPMHEFDTGDGNRGAPKPRHSKHWTQTKFCRSVILLYQVI